jgi:hypothetical protein
MWVVIDSARTGQTKTDACDFPLRTAERRLCQIDNHSKQRVIEMA